ncbi:cation/H(+) antiporter 15-like [Quercus lobata]|nr:cation/H(+) antiporter 15-like [Quercus lobata]
MVQNDLRNVTSVCEPRQNLSSRGIFFDDNPFDFAVPVLCAQLSISALINAFLQLVLSPVGETAFISQMWTGIAMGPSILGKFGALAATIYPKKSLYLRKTLGNFACLLFMFLVGVKMDLSMSTSSFHVIACLLADLNLLNSELGRLATSSSMVNGVHFMLGPMILGLAVPDGWPLGSAIVDKLDSYVSSILLPSYFIIDIESYNSLIITMVLMTQTLTPIVKLLYKPSKRYMGVNRRSIQHTMANEELRLLACTFNQNSTPSIINLLEVSHPMLRSPICFYIVHLMELLGRSSPILVVHQKGKRSSIHSHHSDHVINAFRLYEQHSRGKVMVHPFTAIAPYATMHDEICNLAFEKRVSMVIIPFHKRWILHGSEECDNPIKAVNFKILKNAPCSVGILVDKGTLSGRNLGSRKPLYSIGMIFVGGPDDREALTYAMRMAEHPKVSLTVIQLVQPHKKSNELDFDIIKRFKMPNIHQKHYLYREEVVKDSVEMINVIKSLENLYELILVGRQHESNSPLFMGLTLWNEYPELGYLGDMLVSSESDWKVSVLVVQQ